MIPSCSLQTHRKKGRFSTPTYITHIFYATPPPRTKQREKHKGESQNKKKAPWISKSARLAVWSGSSRPTSRTPPSRQSRRGSGRPRSEKKSWWTKRMARTLEAAPGVRAPLDLLVFGFLLLGHCRHEDVLFSLLPVGFYRETISLYYLLDICSPFLRWGVRQIQVCGVPLKPPTKRCP